MKQQRRSENHHHERNEKQHSVMGNSVSDIRMKKQKQSSEGYQAEQLHLGGSCAI